MQIGSKGNVLVAGMAAKDAEFKCVGEKGTPMVKFGINAADMGEDAIWVNVVAWRGLALSARGIKKGDSVLVAGRLKTREYQEKTYTDLTAQYIGFQGPPVEAYTQYEKTKQPTLEPDDSIDEDLPF